MAQEITRFATRSDWAAYIDNAACPAAVQAISPRSAEVLGTDDARDLNVVAVWREESRTEDAGGLFETALLRGGSVIQRATNGVWVLVAGRYACGHATASGLESSLPCWVCASKEAHHAQA